MRNLCVGRMFGLFGFKAASLVCAMVGLIGLAAPAWAAKQASIIVDAESGAVLHESNSRATTYPASLTKMMTLYLLFEAIDSGRIKLNEGLKVSNAAAKQPATNLRLKAGQKIPVEKAIFALIIHSANDVAVVVAEALAGSEAKFARLMTKTAHDLGMAATTFRNASGLPSAGQVTTARDMAILSRAVISRFPHHYHYFSARSFTFNGRNYATHNRVLKAYPGADGLKTGYIRASGYNVATSVQRNGRRLIAVVMGGKSSRARDNQMVGLLDKGFALAAKELPAQLAYLPGDAKAKQAAAANANFAAVVPPKKPMNSGAAATTVAALEGAVTPPAKPSATSVSVAFLGDPILPAANNGPEVASLELAAAAQSLQPSAAAAEEKNWGVQVGAFTRPEPAERAAAKATREAPALLGGTWLSIDKINSANLNLYRARLIGLTKPDADAACTILQMRQTPCLAFQTNVNLAMQQVDSAQIQAQ